jgi:hypothetical protein
MKKVIGGKVYDTETAELLGEIPRCVILAGNQNSASYAG